MLRMAIVDDDNRYIEKLQSHLKRYQEENNISIQISTFSNGFELISGYEPIYDLLLLDIEMPHLNGMEVAKCIRKSDPHAVIVFITNTAQYAINGYEVNAFDYMMKPVDYTHFSIKFSAAIEVIDKEEELSIIVPIEEGSRYIKSHEIIYIEVCDHWLHIHTKDGTYKKLGSLREMDEKFSTHHFIRCSKSYLINLQYVNRIRSELLIMQGGIELKISRTKRKDVQKAFVDYYNGIRW